MRSNPTVQAIAAALRAEHAAILSKIANRTMRNKAGVRVPAGGALQAQAAQARIAAKLVQLAQNNPPTS